MATGLKTIDGLRLYNQTFLRLNLGCSDRHVAGFLNVDLKPPCDQIVDLTKVWPWVDSSVDAVQAFDIFEHLPDKIHTMNECWRVLKPGANLDLFVPTTDGRGAFQDPTHRSFWTPNDLFYFCEEWQEWARFRESYGITAHFRLIRESHKEYQSKVWKLRAVLQAVK
jgi:predicted SAM-dependent methyltransferase